MFLSQEATVGQVSQIAPLGDLMLPQPAIPEFYSENSKIIHNADVSIEHSEQLVLGAL